MKTSNIYIGHTFHGDSEELSGESDINTITNNVNKFYTVELNLLGGHIISEFLEFDEMIQHSKTHNLVYRYVESTDENQYRKIMVIHNIIGTDKHFGYRNFYGIGKNWKLYINSKSDIVIQHLEFPQNDTTIRFRDFPLEKSFYAYLSCLIYTMTNYHLETKTEILKTFSMLRKYVDN